MDKQKIKNLIAAQFQASIKDLDQSIDFRDTEADLDETNTIDPEDLSHQDESEEIKRRLEEQKAVAQSGLFALEQLNDEATDMVAPGAVVKTDFHLLYIGVPTRTFEMDGQACIGVSTDSPIYRVIEGKKAGDSFELNGKKHTIEQVW